METFFNILLSGLLLGGIYSLVSIGLNLIFGVVRIVNFAQGELVMLGCTRRSSASRSSASVLTVAVVSRCAADVPARARSFSGCVLQPLQNEPMMQIFATFGLLILFAEFVLAITRGEGYSIAGTDLRAVIDRVRLQASLVRVIVFAGRDSRSRSASMLFLQRTLAGKAIRAVAQDRRAARLMGIDVERTFMLTFGIGAALAGLAGALLTPIYTLSPQIGGNFILAAFAVVVLGGLGSVAGAYHRRLRRSASRRAFAGFYIDPALKQAVWFISLHRRAADPPLGPVRPGRRRGGRPS